MKESYGVMPDFASLAPEVAAEVSSANVPTTSVVLVCVCRGATMRRSIVYTSVRNTVGFVDTKVRRMCVVTC